MSSATTEVADALTQLVRHIHCAAHAAARHRSDAFEKSMFAIVARLIEGGPQRLSDLAEAVHLDLSTVSRQVTQLVDRGYVRRRTDPADRRATQLMATPEGERLLAEVHRKRREWVGAMLAAWSPEEQVEFAAYLRRFNAAFEDFLPTWMAELAGQSGTSAPGEPASTEE